MTGTMQTKMPANSLATSRIGPQAKPLALRYSVRVSTSEAQRQGEDGEVAHQVLQLHRHADNGERARRGLHDADRRIAAITPASSGRLASPRTRTVCRASDP